MVDALRHLAAVQEAVQAVQAALAAHDERRQWAAEGAVQAEEGALQAACAAADAWLAELHAAHPPADEAAGGSAGPGGGLVEHERAAAALQAELQALNAAAAGGNDGGGWTTVGPGGRSAAALEGLEDDGDDDDEEEVHAGKWCLIGCVIGRSGVCAMQCCTAPLPAEASLAGEEATCRPNALFLPKLVLLTRLPCSSRGPRTWACTRCLGTWRTLLTLNQRRARGSGAATARAAAPKAAATASVTAAVAAPVVSERADL